MRFYKIGGDFMNNNENEEYLMICRQIDVKEYLQVKKYMIDSNHSEKDGNITYRILEDEYKIRTKYRLTFNNSEGLVPEILFFFDDTTKTLNSLTDIMFYLGEMQDDRGYERTSIDELYDEDIEKMKEFFLLSFPNINYDESVKIIKDNYWNIKCFSE